MSFHDDRFDALVRVIERARDMDEVRAAARRMLGAGPRGGERTEMERQVEEQLRRNRDTFHQMIQNNPFGVYVVDADFRLVQVSLGAQKVFSTVKPLLGRDFEEVLRQLWPEPFVSEALGRFRHTLATGERYRSPSTVERRADIGELESYDWRLERVALPDGRYGVVCYFYDLSDRQKWEAALRKSEAQAQAWGTRLRLALEAGRMGTWDWDVATDEVEWSEGHFTLLGHAPGEVAATHANFSSRVHPEDRPGQEREIRMSREERRDYQCEYRVVWRDGSVHWLAARGKYVFDAAGRAVRMYGILVDIDQAKRAEAELLAAKDAAEQANKSKDHFLAVLSHELRTPLAPVLATAQMLEGDPKLSADHLEMVQTIRRNVQLEARLIDDLLDLTRVTRNKLELRMGTVDVHEKVRHVLAICGEEIREKGLVVETRLEAREHHVRADAARFQQIVWNLVKNAVKFTPGEGRVTVRTGNRNGRLVLAVEDTGIGIPREVLPRVFDAFEQGGREVTRQFGGLGLGLAISKALVELHGGALRAESAGRGRGATFRLEVATVEADVARAQDAAPAGGLRGCTVLLVEDHVDTRKVMERLLKGMGCDVRSAGTVAEAVQRLEAGKPDVVISDIGLPDGSGLELMRQAQAAHGVRGIALSGYGMEEDLAKSREAGFEAHLTKPVDVGVLEETMRRFAGRG